MCVALCECDLHAAVYELQAGGVGARQEVGPSRDVRPLWRLTSLARPECDESAGDPRTGVRYGPGYTGSCTSVSRTILTCHCIFKHMSGN